MARLNKKGILLILQVIVLSVLFIVPSYGDEGDFEFKLSVDSETVVAHYDKSERLITISGEGTILQSSWENLAHKVEGGSTSFTEYQKEGTTSVKKYGWQVDLETKIEFTGDKKSIQLETAGYNNTGYGWFMDFPNTIEFNGVVDTEEMTHMSFMFKNAVKFNDDLSDWNTSSVVSMYAMFYAARAFNNGDPAGESNHPLDFNTKKVTRMNNMFVFAESFNQYLGDEFDTSNVTGMVNLFHGALVFNNGDPVGESNHPLNFNTENVTDMENMFLNAESFNQYLGDDFDTTKVTNMVNLFNKAKSFNNGDPAGESNHPLDFNTKKVTNMTNMFYLAESFNQYLGDEFDTSNVIGMVNLFQGALVFNNGDPVGESNHPLNFNTKNVTDMENMFLNAESFNQHLGDDFDTTNVTNMINMFRKAKSFNNGDPAGESNHPLDFNTKKVTNMTNMFLLAESFNQYLGDEFDTSNVTEMVNLFHGARVFNNGDPAGESNHPVNFNTKKITNMTNMFYLAESFNQYLGDEFDTSNVTGMVNLFHDARVFNNGDPAGESNHPLNFNTKKVANMTNMFVFAESFNQYLGDEFDTSNVRAMVNLFHGALVFNNGDPVGESNHPLNFNTENVTDMENMFLNAKSFNQHLGDDFDTTNVTNMVNLFYNANSMTKIDLLNRYNIPEDLELDDINTLNIFTSSNPDVLRFRNLPSITWKGKKGTNYWVRIGDGEPKQPSNFVPEDDIAWNSGTKTFIFSEGVKYELAKKEIPNATTANYFEKDYDDVAVTIDDIPNKSVEDGVTGVWTLDYKGEIKDVGDYHALCTFTPDDRDTYAKTRVDVTIRINKANPSVEVPSGLRATYGDTVQSITLTNPSGNIKGNWSFIDSTLTVGNAGTNQFSVTFEPEDTKNYNAISKQVMVEVAKKEVAIEGLVVADKDYDGNTTASPNYTGLSGVITGDDVAIDSLTATFHDENVGEDKPVTITATLKGEMADNYTVIVPTDKIASIRKADFNISVPEGLRGWQGGTLSEVRIPVVDGGIWKFDAESTILSRTGKHRYNITFTPSNSNYKVMSTTVEVEVLEYSEEKPFVDEEENKEEDVIEEEKTTPESSSNSLPFEDVEKSDWFYDSVKSTYKKSVLKGTSENKFSPRLKVTRGMMITSIYNMNGKEDVVETSDFNDIAKDSYYEKAVNWGQKNSVVKGYGKDFRPDKPILRQEMVAMLYRYRNCDCYEHIAGDAKLIQEFSDASEVSGYARDAMDWALSTGLIIGRSEDVLAPREVLTRAELATILERFSRLVK